MMILLRDNQMNALQMVQEQLNHEMHIYAMHTQHEFDDEMVIHAECSRIDDG